MGALPCFVRAVLDRGRHYFLRQEKRETAGDGLAIFPARSGRSYLFSWQLVGKARFLPQTLKAARVKAILHKTKKPGF
jgi:hypothetical protein